MTLQQLSILLVSGLCYAGCSSPEALANDETAGTSAFTLDPSRGSEVGFAYEAFLSPHQEAGEEEDTPPGTPDTFKSTTPSTPRMERLSRGHGMVRFTRDLSRALIDVKIEEVDPSSINLFHLHCGRPDQLGPIILDIGMFVDLNAEFSDGVLSFEADFTHIEETQMNGHGALGGFLAGCPIVQGIDDDHKTISGMKYVADQGELYFNLHTTGQTYWGDIRGRLHAISVP